MSFSLKAVEELASLHGEPEWVRVRPSAGDSYGLHYTLDHPEPVESERHDTVIRQSGIRDDS